MGEAAGSRARSAVLAKANHAASDKLCFTNTSTPRWHVLRPRSKPVCARIYIRAAGPRARPHAGGDSTETPAAKLSGRAHAVWRLRAVTEQTRRGRTLSGPRRGQGGQPGHRHGSPVTPARPGICPRQTGGGDSAANRGPEVSTGGERREPLASARSLAASPGGGAPCGPHLPCRPLAVSECGPEWKQDAVNRGCSNLSLRCCGQLAPSGGPRAPDQLVSAPSCLRASAPGRPAPRPAASCTAPTGTGRQSAQ